MHDFRKFPFPLLSAHLCLQWANLYNRSITSSYNSMIIHKPDRFCFYFILFICNVSGTGIIFVCMFLMWNTWRALRSHTSFLNLGNYDYVHFSGHRFRLFIWFLKALYTSQKKVKNHLIYWWTNSKWFPSTCKNRLTKCCLIIMCWFCNIL